MARSKGEGKVLDPVILCRGPAGEEIDPQGLLGGDCRAPARRLLAKWREQWQRAQKEAEAGGNGTGTKEA
jgi:hypothetical protein